MLIDIKDIQLYVFFLQVDFFCRVLSQLPDNFNCLIKSKVIFEEQKIKIAELDRLLIEGTNPKVEQNTSLFILQLVKIWNAFYDYKKIDKMQNNKETVMNAMM